MVDNSLVGEAKRCFFDRLDYSYDVRGRVAGSHDYRLQTKFASTWENQRNQLTNGMA